MVLYEIMNRACPKHAPPKPQRHGLNVARQQATRPCQAFANAIRHANSPVRQPANPPTHQQKKTAKYAVAPFYCRTFAPERGLIQNGMVF